MFRKVVALLIVLAFAAPAAAGPVTGFTGSSIVKAVKDVAGKESAPASSKGRNRFLWPAVAVMGTGAAGAAWGFLRTDTTVTTDCLTINFTVTCSHTQDTNRDTTLGVAGLGIVGAGVVLLLVGNGRRAVADVSFGPRRVKITRKFTF